MALQRNAWLFVGLLVFVAAHAFAQVNGEKTGYCAVLENAKVRVEYDLSKGTYDVIDKSDDTTCLADAGTNVDLWYSDLPGWKHDAVFRDIRDVFGSGKAMLVTSIHEGDPSLLLELILYENQPFIALRAGVGNATSRVLQVRQIHPISGASAFGEGYRKRLIFGSSSSASEKQPETPDDSSSSRLAGDARVLTGNGGAGDSIVERCLYRRSGNDLLLTCKSGKQRHSFLMGGLKYAQFEKFVALTEHPSQKVQRRRLASNTPPGARQAVYLDAGAEDVTSVGFAKFDVVAGTPFTWSGAGYLTDMEFATVLFDDRQVVLRASGLDPKKFYALGFSWWDYDNNGRRESVVALGANGTSRVLVKAQALPARLSGSLRNPAEITTGLRPETYSSGSVDIAFRSDAPGLNAVVCEAWLWERDDPFSELAVVPSQCPCSCYIPWFVDSNPSRPQSLFAELYAQDPVGHRVDPGVTYMPEDSFYVDCVTHDPFVSLEQYGLSLRAANAAEPNVYDFPTICAWYVGLFNYGEAQNRPEKSKYRIATTPGLVEEMDHIAQCGFLKYARAAVRLVPDKYPNTEPVGGTEQGWWDDEHWGRYGHYVAPYETSAKYGQAIRERGGLPFTYFQCIYESPDFREAHPEMFLANDPKRGLDYTDPATQAHMREVYRNMREGGITGMMFDYPNDAWVSQFIHGGFEDPYATAASAYRTLFTLAKTGLGHDSWIHERVLGLPNSDITIGVVDSQRIWGDNSTISPEMVSRCGLRWYKNRVGYAYDMDAKDLLTGWKSPNFTGTDQDGRRMLLTMAYVAGSRLLLATSFRDMPPETLYDLERTFPYHRSPKSARPVDAFVAEKWPRVYDFAVTSDWHQVTFYNNAEPTVACEIGAALSGEPADGALALDPGKEYYAYDFWNDGLVGRVKGTDRLVQTLRPGEARMMSIHAVEPNPQFLSTNRHIMQGYVDMPMPPKWNADAHKLEGISSVIAGEPYVVTIALNGMKPGVCTASKGNASIQTLENGLARLTIDSSDNADITWSIAF